MTSKKQEETTHAATKSAAQATPDAVAEEAPVEEVEAAAEAVAEAQAEEVDDSGEAIEAVPEETPAEEAEAPAEAIEAVAEETPAELIIVEPVTSLDDVKRAMRFGEVLGHTLASLHTTLDKRGVARARANELTDKLTASVFRSISNVLEGRN